MSRPATDELVARLRRRAQEQASRGRFDLAVRTLTRALDLTDGLGAGPGAGELRVRLLLSLANAEYEAGSPARGERRLAEARELAEREARPGLAATVDSVSAFRLLRSGDPAAAVAAFGTAERGIAAARTLDAAVLYLNRGTLHLQRTELDRARRDLTRCLALAQGEHPDQTPDDQHELSRVAFKARHNLGYLEFLSGDLPRSLALMDAAAADADDVSLGISALDRARVLLEAGLSDAADAALRVAEAEFRRGRLHQELAETELARAEAATLAGDLRSARRLAGSARDRFRRRGNPRWRRVAELALLAADLADGRPPARLVAPADRLAEEFGAAGLDLPARTASLIACAALTAAGELERAGRRLAEVHPASRRDPIALRLQQRAVTAELLRRTGRVGPARTQIRTGLAELTRHQARFGSIDLQSAAATHGSTLVGLDLDLALDSGRPAPVFDAVERGRAVSRRLTPVTPPADESAEPLAELRQLTETLRTIGDEPAMAAETAQVRRRIAELMDRLRAVSWRTVGVGAVAQPATLAAVADRAAREAKVLVSYVQRGGRWWAVLVGRGRPRLVRLPGDDGTLELVRRAHADLTVLALPGVPGPLRAAAQGSLGHTLAGLDRLLVAPLGLADEALVVVPTGPTSTLPWGCLPRLRGRSVEVAPTATSWVWGTEQVDSAAGRVDVRAFAGPGLQAADAEVDRVAARWAAAGHPARSFVGTGATRDRLAAALVAAPVVHVAAHGTHNRQNPLFSSLRLADGPLFAYEIADRHVPGHVVLSACELGQSTTRPGDEALGLTRVLLQLGSQCVLAGVSQVNDRLAGSVMAAYHARLAAGEDSATALAGAAEAAGEPVPFVCFGSSWRAVPAPGEAPGGQRRGGCSPTLR